MYETDIALSRDAFDPREVARAGDLWRAFQDLAVFGSSEAGWPPPRYVAEGVSFIVRAMTVVHHRATSHGEALRGSTWPSGFKRGIFFRRECRIRGEDGAPVASATQDWVHVSAELKLVRASDALVEAFPIESRERPIELPAREAVEGAPTHGFAFEVWHGWMDPLGHVNHPRYVDWADEGLARAVADAGLDPQGLRAHAESARYKAGTVAGDRVHVATRLVGRAADGAAVVEHAMTVDDRPVCRVTTHRSHPDADLVERLSV